MTIAVDLLRTEPIQTEYAAAACIVTSRYTGVNENAGWWATEKITAWHISNGPVWADSKLAIASAVNV